MLRPIALASFGLAASTLILSQVGHADRKGRSDASLPGVHAVLPATELDGTSTPAIGGCLDRILSSPVMVYTSAGGTLLGLELDQVTLYSSGLVLIASADSHSGGMSARMAMVSPAEVVRLARQLGQLGAYTACDQEYEVTDVPLKTISLARATGQDVSLHSFSYWIGAEQYGVFESAIEQWMFDNELIGASRE